MTVKLHDSFAIHPGPWLKNEIIKPYGMSVAAVAKHLKVDEPVLIQLLDGSSRLTADLAIRFERAFRTSAATLLRMQTSHDLALARRQLGSLDISVVRPASQ